MVSMSLLVCLLAWFQLMNNPAVTYADAEHQGHLFWITCKWLKLLRKASHLQVFRNSAPSVARRHQCDIMIRPLQFQGSLPLLLQWFLESHHCPLWPTFWHGRNLVLSNQNWVGCPCAVERLMICLMVTIWPWDGIFLLGWNVTFSFTVAL